MDKNNEPEVEESLDLPAVVEGAEDTTDYKAEALKLRDKAIAQRERTKTLKQQLADARKAVEVVAGSPKTPSPVKTGELDENALLFLEVKGLKTDIPEEMTLVETWRTESGKTAKEIWASKIFQAELKEIRHDAAVKDATPSGTKRSGGSQSNDLELAKQKYVQSGYKELPEDFALRTAVVNATYDKENPNKPSWQK